MFRSIGVPELLLVLFVIPIFFGIFLLPFWKIFEKAGYPGVLGLLMLVPIVNFVVLLFLAFSDWPVLRQLRAAQVRDAGASSTA